MSYPYGFNSQKEFDAYIGCLKKITIKSSVLLNRNTRLDGSMFWCEIGAIVPITNQIDDPMLKAINKWIVIKYPTDYPKNYHQNYYYSYTERIKAELSKTPQYDKHLYNTLNNNLKIIKIKNATT